MHLYLKSSVSQLWGLVLFKKQNINPLQNAESAMFVFRVLAAFVLFPPFDFKRTVCESNPFLDGSQFCKAGHLFPGSLRFTNVLLRRLAELNKILNCMCPKSSCCEPDGFMPHGGNVLVSRGYSGKLFCSFGC